uniref:Protein JASON n=1 Tax=Mesocestoides corti TaxID=53468 RepID=A0A5K3FLN8_MESCO
MVRQTVRKEAESGQPVRCGFLNVASYIFIINFLQNHNLNKSLLLQTLLIFPFCV